MKIKINKDELFELLQDDVVKESSVKWGVNVTEHVVYNNKDYLVTYERHPSEGIQGDSFTLIPCQRQERMVVEWIAIK